MARLTRKNIKVFAESASNNGVFGSLQAGNATVSNDVETIQSLAEAWSGGWNYATMTGEKLPPLEEFQGIQYVTTYQQAYIMQEGMPEWSASVTYYKGSLTKKVTTTGFQIYSSLTDNNINHQLSDTSNWKLVMDSANLYAFDNAVVHLAGAETITGAKTFTAQPQFAPGYGIRFNTDNGSSEHYVMRSSGNPSVGLSMFLNNDTSKAAFNISPTKITIGSNTILPNSITPSASDDSTRIATTAWVNAVGNNVVHKTGTETITGSKTFTSYIKEQRSNPQVELVNTDVTTGTSKNYDQTWWLRFEDTNGRTMGAIRSAYLKDSTNMVVYMRAVKSGASGDTDFADLSIHYPSTGNPFATAPASDVNGSILTTVNKSKSANGYFQLGNGMIVQWGRVTAGASTTPSITFPKAFTSATSYSFASTPYNASNTNSYTEHLKAYSKTGVTLFCGPGWNPIFWIAIGY